MCFKKICYLCFVFILPFFILACTPVHRPPISPATLSRLQHGKRLFEGGYYKRSMRELLPLACDGNAEAQYAVGYMYYYGYGVGQDTQVGYFWIKRAAEKNFEPAGKALNLIHQNRATGPAVSSHGLSTRRI